MNKKIYTLTLFSLSYLSICAADGGSEDFSINKERSLSHFGVERTDRTTGNIVHPTMVVFNYSLHPEIEDSIDSLDRSKVSAHFLIGQDGTTHQLVNPTYRAWHAGHARFKLGDTLEKDINSHSIGIIVANRGLTTTPQDESAQHIKEDVGLVQKDLPTYGYPCTPKQIAAIIALAAHLQKEGYNLLTYTSHAEVATNPDGIAGRKIGPGPVFPWKELAEKGIGLWPQADESTLPESEDNRIKEAQRFLHLQHDCPETGVIDQHTKALLISFQMHFTPGNITGKVDEKTLRAMRGLQSQISALQEQYRKLKS